MKIMVDITSDKSAVFIDLLKILKKDKMIKNYQISSNLQIVKKETKQVKILSDKTIEYAKLFDIVIKNSGTRVYNIMKMLKKRKQFSQESVIWLYNNDLMKDKLKEEYYKREKTYNDNYPNQHNLKEIENKKVKVVKVKATPIKYQKNQTQISTTIPLDEVIAYAKRFSIYIESKNEELYAVMTRVKNKKRFSSEDAIWLMSERGYEYPKLKKEYHHREAKYYEDNFLKTNDEWNIVNASSEYRKAENSKKSISIIEKINIKTIKDLKLKSALITTQGGAYRDLNMLDKALTNAQKGFSFTPNNFRPCTLRGAVHYDKKEYEKGDYWFTKAEENGAETNNIDSEIKNIYKRLKGQERKELQKHLLSIDKERYRWILDSNYKKTKANKNR